MLTREAKQIHYEELRIEVDIRHHAVVWPGIRGDARIDG